MRHTYNMNLFRFPNAVTYYILGAWVTDGNVSIRGTHSYLSRISSNDLEWIEKLRIILYPTLPICISKSKNRKNTHYSLNITNKEIARWFVNNNCIPNKSLILEFPPNIPKEYMPDFIRGCLDGDGWISLQNQKQSKNKRLVCGLSSGSLNFINSFQKIYNEYNLKSSICIEKGGEELIFDRIYTTQNNYKLMVSGKSSEELCKLCYYDGHEISMKRKNDNAQKLIKYYGSHLSDPDRNCKIKWLKPDELALKVKNSNYTVVAKELGVAPISVKRRLMKFGINI